MRLRHERENRPPSVGDLISRETLRCAHGLLRVYFPYMDYIHIMGSGQGFEGFGMMPHLLSFGLGLFALMLWSLVWKGLALWRAASRKELAWFIVFLIVNTAGILEIIYLFYIAKDANLRSAVGMKTDGAPTSTESAPPQP